MYNIIMAEEKPTAAFVLSLIGGIFILIASILSMIITVFGLLGSAFSFILFFGMIGGLLIILGIVGFIFAILVIIGTAMINSGVPHGVRTGGIPVLIFSILSLLTSGGGFFIGFILGLVGGILALVWKPSKAPVTQEAKTAPPPS
jgi:hypothetical protein